MSLYSNQMVSEVLSRAAEGDDVITDDGEKLGTVAGIEHQCLKVSAPLSRDYWLPGDTIVESGGGAVRVCFAKGDLNAYKLSKAAPVEDPTTGQEEDTIVPPEEQLEQRQRMEAELEAQRRQRELGQRRSA